MVELGTGERHSNGSDVTLAPRGELKPMELQDFLREAIATSFRDLMRTQSVESAILTDHGHHHDLAAVIGFSADRLTGNLAVASSQGAIDLLGEVASATSPGDWLGELSNQLLGRLKRSFATHLVKLTIGTPIVVKGERLRILVSDSSHHVATVAFQIPGGPMAVTVSLRLLPGFEWVGQTVEDDSIPEGDACLF